MTQKLTGFLVLLLLVGIVSLCGSALAIPKASVGYKLYHYENDTWVRYNQDDPFPPGGATPGTNLWKYTYCVSNLQFTTGIYLVWIFFNGDNVLRATRVSEAAPTGWTALYYPPFAPNNNWKVRFRTTTPAYYVMLGNTLCGCEVQFTWIIPNLLPGPQDYDAITSGGSETGVTEELPPDPTPVNSTSWGKIKSLFK
ncbi:MAG: hypothetical protein V2A71_00765 [Candidatus Eisenbacteria bacterium]